VVRQVSLPDIGLLLLAPMILVGGHLTEKGYALYQLWWLAEVPSGSHRSVGKTSDQITINFPVPETNPEASPKTGT
jgi:hypothetical protein